MVLSRMITCDVDAMGNRNPIPPFKKPGARFSKVPIDGPVTAGLVYMHDRGFNSFASNMIKLSVNEIKWSSLLARTHALILFISI